MTRLFTAAFLLTSALTLGLTARGQEEGPVPTQVLVGVDAKSMAPADASALTVLVNDHKVPLTAWAPVLPANAQVALLIDDGLRTSMGRELSNLGDFVRGLAPGVEIMIGFMQYGHVVAEQPFTTDHAQVASTLHLPEGVPGMSASPYICISDFVKHWPDSGASSSSVTGVSGAAPRKARFVLAITNGVDPYNGSTSIMNQGSPYVDNAVSDAQRAGVVVYAIYFSDAGIRGPSADNSGQDYLAELTQGTGGISFWEGVGNPVSTAPFLAQFQHAVAETYIATFPVPAGRDPQRDLAHVKITAGRAKLHVPVNVLPGNQE